MSETVNDNPQKEKEFDIFEHFAKWKQPEPGEPKNGSRCATLENFRGISVKLEILGDRHSCTQTVEWDLHHGYHIREMHGLALADKKAKIRFDFSGFAERNYGLVTANYQMSESYPHNGQRKNFIEINVQYQEESKDPDAKPTEFYYELLLMTEIPAARDFLVISEKMCEKGKRYFNIIEKDFNEVSGMPSLVTVAHLGFMDGVLYDLHFKVDLVNKGRWTSYRRLTSITEKKIRQAGTMKEILAMNIMGPARFRSL